MKRLLLLCFASALFIPLVWSQEKVDLETISRIRYEGFRDSKVMEFASGLMDSIGERLTGSPNMKRANEWTRDQLTALGLTNAHLEAWGPFGRGWAKPVRQRADDIAGRGAASCLCESVDARNERLGAGKVHAREHRGQEGRL